MESFPPEVTAKLKTYVYRLIDPRNGETFYIGKGQGNRVFAHIREQVEEDDPNNKLRRIRDIHLAGFEVQHVIHRHGLDERTAFEVEAALMDAYPGLTNMASGLGNAKAVRSSNPWRWMTCCTSNPARWMSRIRRSLLLGSS